MSKLSKRQKAMQGKVDHNRSYAVADALKLAKDFATAKFDESIDVAVSLGIQKVKVPDLTNYTADEAEEALKSRGLTAEQITLETRIITTADIFDAITAERPYRGAVPVAKTLAIMREEVDKAIDARCLAALERIVDGLGLG